jgi:hypothetical protein
LIWRIKATLGDRGKVPSSVHGCAVVGMQRSSVSCRFKVLRQNDAVTRLSEDRCKRMAARFIIFINEDTWSRQVPICRAIRHRCISVRLVHHVEFNELYEIVTWRDQMLAN